jgi:hypothetical protein
MRQSNLADRGRASKDARFGCCLPMRVPPRLWLLAVLALLVVHLALGVQRWEKEYGWQRDDAAWGVWQAPDAGYFVLGSAAYGLRFQGVMWLLRTDSLGDTSWTRVFWPTPTGHFYANAMTSMQDGGFVLAGHYWSAGSVDTICIYLVRADSLGDTLWTRKLYPSLLAVPNDVVRTRDGGCVLVGSANPLASPDSVQGYALKLDSLGNEVWFRRYGDYGCDGPCAVALAPDNGFIVAGATLAQPNQIIRAWLLRTDSLCDTLWTRTYSSGDPYDDFQAVRALPDGGFVAAGTSESGQVGSFYLVRTDSLGGTLWTRRYGETGTNSCNGLWATADGGFILVGSTDARGQGGYDVWLVKVDAGGDTEWTRTFGGIDWDYGNAVQQTADGGYVVAGNTGSFGAGANDVYVVKTDESGFAAVRDAPTPPAASSAPIPEMVVQLTDVVRYYVPGPGPALLVLFDAAGRKRATLVSASESAGWHETRLPPELSSGAFILRLTSVGGSVATKFVRVSTRD